MRFFNKKFKAHGKFPNSRFDLSKYTMAFKKNRTELPTKSATPAIIGVALLFYINFLTANNYCK
jgi:hypothetical protein